MVAGGGSVGAGVEVGTIVAVGGTSVGGGVGVEAGSFLLQAMTAVRSARRRKARGAVRRGTSPPLPRAPLLARRGAVNGETSGADAS
jgi:hypothetical protein